MPGCAGCGDAEEAGEKLVLIIRNIPSAAVPFKLVGNFLYEAGHLDRHSCFDIAEMLNIGRTGIS